METHNGTIIVMKTSIVVMSHNNIAATHKCISSLMKILGPDRELIVLDDQSSDGSGEYVEKLNNIAPNIKGIVFDKKVGLCAGRNEGLRQSKGENILFLDNDTYSDTDFLAILEQKMESLHADIVGMCAVATFDCKTYFHIHQKDLKSPIETMSVTGYCLMIKRAVLDEIGDFDLVYDIMDEDIDICMRALKKGYKVFAADNIPLIHTEHGSGFATSDKFHARMLRNHKILEDKYLDFVRNTDWRNYKISLVDNMTRGNYDIRLTNIIGDYYFYDSHSGKLVSEEKNT